MKHILIVILIVAVLFSFKVTAQSVGNGGDSIVDDFKKTVWEISDKLDHKSVDLVFIKLSKSQDEFVRQEVNLAALLYLNGDKLRGKICHNASGDFCTSVSSTGEMLYNNRGDEVICINNSAQNLIKISILKWQVLSQNEKRRQSLHEYLSVLNIESSDVFIVSDALLDEIYHLSRTSDIINNSSFLDIFMRLGH